MRPLFTSESDVVYAMLAHASDPMHSLSAEQRKAIAARVPELKVYKHCGCGTCPTVYLTAGEEPPEPHRDANGKAVPQGSSYVLTADCPGAMVLLHITDGVPVELEVAPFDDQKVELPWPDQLLF
ncbi:hypothetical protein [Corynebacterium phoceense]|uniref:hypothetical protein n=1 Tax=Corynebacterium phoceense TaxID=1686286 RepID=UPI0018A8DA8D|nr:hypothetical protein [Corynebacterium phoceense]MBF9010263.1 hypothetical protein [Corynebacterium phoceense]